jgi:membrane protease subunit HflC
MRNLPTLLVAALVAAVIVLMMCAFQVRFTETAVVTRFDQIRRVVSPAEAGLHFKLPWPIEQVHRFDTRLRTFETEFRQIGTEDQKTVILTAYSTWRIVDGEKFLKVVGREDAAGRKIQDVLENRVSTVLRTHPLGHLVNTDPAEMRYGQIEEEILAGTRDIARDSYGIEMVSVGIKRLGIPQSVTREVFTRMKEDRQKTIKELTAEGEAKAKEIKAEADEIAGKILARAEAYARKIEGQGDAEAARYYSQYAEHRKLIDFLKKRETLQKILHSGQTTLVLDANRFELFNMLMEAASSVKPEASDKATMDNPRAAANQPPVRRGGH